MNQEPFLFKDTLLFIDSWNSIDKRIVAGMTTRLGGYSKRPYHSMNLGLHVNDNPRDVIRNREQLSKILGTSLETWVCGEQVHGAKITKVTKNDRGKGSLNMESAIKGVDGYYTKERNIFLITAYADCVPLYFFAPKYDLIGMAHAGWRGTVSNIASDMINLWTMIESVPIDEILVCIGPSIGDCCYIVDDYVIDELAKNLDVNLITSVYNEVSPGQYRLNLKQANLQLIMKAGVLPTNIEVTNYCTCCQSDLFFSHRRDKGKTGRMVSFIGMKDE